MSDRWVSQSSRWIMALALCAGLGSSAFAANINPAQTVTGLEQQLFAHTYPMDAMNARLDRLESTVFGAPDHTHTEEARLSALSPYLKTTHPAPVAGYGPPSQAVATKPVLPVQPTETNYPVVTSMESQVFGRSYPKEPLENRLDRLDSRVFGRPQPGEMNDRTDHLRAVVLHDNVNQPSNTAVAYGAPAGAAVGPANSGRAGTQASADVSQALDELEKKTFRQTYSREPVTARLDRLEMKVFNQTAPDMSSEDRLYRVVSVMTAQRSSHQEQAYSGGMGMPYGGSGYGVYGTTRGGFSMGTGGLGTGGYYGRYGQVPSRGTSPMGMTLLILLMGLL